LICLTELKNSQFIVENKSKNPQKSNKAGPSYPQKEEVIHTKRALIHKKGPVFEKEHTKNPLVEGIFLWENFRV